MVSELRLMPSPKLAMVAPWTKCVPTAVMATLSVWPCVPKAGVTAVMVCCSVGSAMVNAEIREAVSVPPPESGVLTAMLQAP